MNFTSTATSGEQSFLAHAALWRRNTKATLRNVEQQWNWPPEPWKFQYQKMEGIERQPPEKRPAQTTGYALPRLQWEEEMERYEESAFKWVVGSVVSFFSECDFCEEMHRVLPISATKHIFYSECVGIIMDNPTHYESDTCLNKFAQKWPKRMFQIFSTVQMQTWSHAAIFCHSFHSGLRHYPSKFGLKMVELFDRLIGSSSGMPANPTWFPPACSTFSSMNWDDLWHEAHMTQVCHYLRAGKDLKVPEEFRNHLPHKL